MSRRRHPHRNRWILALTGALLCAAPAFAAGESADDQMPVKHIKMFASNWEWDPDVIRVQQGTKVVIDFESHDASHSFVLKEFKVKLSLPEGKKGLHVEFVANKAGEFRWKCGRPCGDGCPKMRGTLIVQASEQGQDAP